MFGVIEKKRPSPAPAELWFGEERLPSAGRLVEVQPRKERRGKAGKRKKESPDSPAICLINKNKIMLDFH